MSLISRLEAQNSRIWRYIVAESTTLADGRDWIPEDRLMSIWTRPISGEEHKNELDEFQECVSSTDLARNLYSAIKTISILICIRWHQWHEFAERFCRLTGKATLDDLQDIDDRLPFTKESLQYLLFPDSSLDANSFFVRQYAFLPLVLEENQTFRSYQSEYRLPLLDEAKLGPIKQRDRLITVKIAEGCFRFARREEFNSTPLPLRRKRVLDPPDIEREIRNLAILRTAEETNDRILRHLVALKIGPEYNIFFNDAELDMEMLLSGEYQPFYADSNIAPQALIKQAWHLAGALHFLHHRLVDRRKRITCCHMDLKPANILILRHRDMPIGKWMLIDFGISVIRTEPRSAGSAADLFTDEYRMLPASVTKSSRYLSDYQPPEVEQSLPVSLIGDETRKGDIWSFGCILLVLLMFSLGGAPLVNKLHATKRSEGQTDFFYLALDAGARPVAKAKSKVKRWAYQMGNHQGSWAYEFLQLVFEHMLQVPVDMRQDANQIQDQLDVVWRQAPTENIWNSLPQNPRVRTMSPPWNESIATSVSLLSSRRPSGAAIMASTFELDPHTPSRDRSVDPLLLGRESPKGDFPPLSPKTSDSTETHSTGSTTQLLPAAEMSLRDDLPSADDMAVFSDSAYIVFWHGQSVIPYSRNYSTWRPDGPMFSREVSGTVSAGLEAKHPDKWIDISLSGSYIAMIKSSPSSILVKAIDLNLGQFVLPSTEWPPFQCLRSVCVSSHGSLALIYDKKITFRFVGGPSDLRNSSWGTASENVCAASFSRDGERFFAVSWNKLWIGTIQRTDSTEEKGKVEQRKWVLRAGGDHHLSSRTYVSFRPYLVPFTSREALFAHNPAEDKLQYLEDKSSQKVDLGSGVIRIALSEGEDMLVYIRKLQRHNRLRFLPQPYYGLTYRSIGRTQSGALSLGPEGETTDLNITVEKNKMFSLTSSVELGVNVAWVATAKGEIRKCRLT